MLYKLYDHKLPMKTKAEYEISNQRLETLSGSKLRKQAIWKMEFINKKVSDDHMSWLPVGAGDQTQQPRSKIT